MTATVDLLVPVPADRAATSGRFALLQRLYWLWPALLAGLVVGFGAGRAQLWRDEFATWSAAARTPSGLSDLSGHIDAVISPYYWVMHVWIAVFGDSARTMRIPSVLAVAATAGLLAVLGARVLSVRAGVFGGLLLAVLPAVSRYGQEARPYALAALAATAASVLLIEALHHGRWWRWTFYGLAILALGALHLVAVTLLAAHGTAVAYQAVRSRSWRPVVHAGVAAAAAVSALVPLALSGSGQLSAQLGSKVQPPTWETVLHLVEELSGAVAVGGLLTGLLILGFGAGLHARITGLSLLAPLAALVAVAHVSTIWHARYLLFLLPLVCLLAGAALARVPLAGGLAVVLVVALLGLPDHRRVRGSHESRSSQLIDYRAAAAVIEQNRQPGDAIVHKRDGWHFADIAMEYYLGADAPRDALAATDRVTAGSYWTPERTDVAAATAGDTRVWSLVPDQLVTRKELELPEAVRSVLDRDFQEERKWRVSGITLRLYVRK